jgi:hypothetical protein
MPASCQLSVAEGWVAGLTTGFGVGTSGGGATGWRCEHAAIKLSARQSATWDIGWTGFAFIAALWDVSSCPASLRTDEHPGKQSIHRRQTSKAAR